MTQYGGPGIFFVQELVEEQMYGGTERIECKVTDVFCKNEACESQRERQVCESRLRSRISEGFELQVHNRTHVEYYTRDEHYHGQCMEKFAARIDAEDR